MYTLSSLRRLFAERDSAQEGVYKLSSLISTNYLALLQLLLPFSSVENSLVSSFFYLHAVPLNFFFSLIFFLLAHMHFFLTETLEVFFSFFNFPSRSSFPISFSYFSFADTYFFLVASSLLSPFLSLPRSFSLNPHLNAFQHQEGLYSFLIHPLTPSPTIHT